MIVLAVVGMQAVWTNRLHAPMVKALILNPLQSSSFFCFNRLLQSSPSIFFIFSNLLHSLYALFALMLLFPYALFFPYKA